MAFSCISHSCINLMHLVHDIMNKIYVVIYEENISKIIPNIEILNVDEIKINSFTSLNKVAKFRCIYEHCSI